MQRIKLLRDAEDCRVDMQAGSRISESERRSNRLDDTLFTCMNVSFSGGLVGKKSNRAFYDFVRPGREQTSNLYCVSLISPGSSI